MARDKKQPEHVRVHARPSPAADACGAMRGRPLCPRTRHMSNTRARTRVGCASPPGRRCLHRRAPLAHSVLWCITVGGRRCAAAVRLGVLDGGQEGQAAHPASSPLRVQLRPGRPRRHGGPGPAGVGLISSASDQGQNRPCVGPCTHTVSMCMIVLRSTMRRSSSDHHDARVTAATSIAVCAGNEDAVSVAAMCRV